MEFAMISDGQVKELRRMLLQGKSLAASARMTEMSDKTARHYRDDDRLPSERKSARTYRTRPDPFAEVWPAVQRRLEDQPRLKAHTLFCWLQQTHPGEFPDSTRRTFERRVSQWQALFGPGKPVMFPQQHHPGRLAASDFTVCNSLGVRIAGARFDHTLFHCVLTYSNVESVSLCFSESFEALSTGIQKAFWEFGGTPQRHRSDSLSAAINNHSNRKSHTARYTALMQHYDCRPERTNARCANENGDVESSNNHLKQRLDQALLLRGSRDFASRADYMSFVETIVDQANARRRDRFAAEQAVLQRLPKDRLNVADLLTGVRVNSSSTIQVRTNTYSVPSRLIGRKVDVRIEAETIEVTYQDHVVQTMPRLFGKKGVAINYRHVIDTLVRKPGAFANYRFREEMFPTSQFRIAYDMLHEAHAPKVADKTYVKLLEIAARVSQDAVADALRVTIRAGQPIELEKINALVQDALNLRPATALHVEPPNLNDYDSLLTMFNKEVDHDEQSNEQTESKSQVAGGNIRHATGRQPGGSDDRAVPPVADAGISRALRNDRSSGGTGEPEPSGLSGRIDNPGVRSSVGRADQTLDESIEAAAGQDLGVVRFSAGAADGKAPAGDVAGRFVPESPGERVVVRQARSRQESRALCVGPAVDSAGAQSAVYDLRDARSTAVDCQAGLAVAEVIQTTGELRGPDHRRPRVRAAEPRGDGGVVHAVGRALRTRQRVVDQQLGVQQVGSDLQGHDDDRSGDRPTGASQRDHRAQRAQLPSRDRKEVKGFQIIGQHIKKKVNLIAGNSNCR